MSRYATRGREHLRMPKGAMASMRKMAKPVHRIPEFEGTVHPADAGPSGPHLTCRGASENTFPDQYTRQNETGEGHMDGR